MTKQIQFTWSGKRWTLGTSKLSERQIGRVKLLIQTAIAAEGDAGD